jgi:hypothetical protein
MTHLDPRDPRRADIDPLMPEARRPEFDQPAPASDPRFDRAKGNSWAVVGGLAAALVLVIVLMSMFGSPSDQTARSPDDQRPPVAQGAPGATPPASDPTTTGTVPRQPPAQMQPAPIQPAPAQPAPGSTPNQQP